MKAPVRKPDADEATGIDHAVDSLFIRWAQNWFTDRYVRASSHVEEVSAKDNDYLVKGTFSFTRGGGTATIPFASTLTRSNDFNVTNLCYNDTTSGMTDCTATGQSSAATRMMTTVILAGVASGLSGSNASSSGGNECRMEEYCTSQNQYGQCQSYNSRQVGCTDLLGNKH